MESAKHRIIAAFWKLAEKKPVHMMKVKHVTDLAACNRCTFYQYFDDIYDLLDQAENLLLEEIQQTIDSAHAPGVSYQETLRIAAAGFQQYGKYLSLLFGVNGSPSFQAKYKQALRPVISSLLPANASFDKELLCEYATGAFLSAVCYWYDHPDRMTAEQLAAMIYQLMTEGVLYPSSSAQS